MTTTRPVSEMIDKTFTASLEKSPAKADGHTSSPTGPLSSSTPEA